MDISTLVGLIAGGALLAYMAGPQLGALHGGICLLVFLGGIALTMIALPLADVAALLKVIGNAFWKKKPDFATLIRRFAHFADTARRQGILALEEELDDSDDPFLQQGILLAVDGTEPDLIMDILETELLFLEERHRHGRKILSILARSWALFGGLGALLILALGRQSSGLELVGQTALPLLCGFALAALVGWPFADKLQILSQREILSKKMVIEGVMAVQSGDHPYIVQHKLSVFLAPADRPEAPPPLSSDEEPAEQVDTSPEAFPPAEIRPTDEDPEKTNLLMRLLRQEMERRSADTRLLGILGHRQLGEVSIPFLVGDEICDAVRQQLESQAPELIRYLEPTAPGANLEGVMGRMADRQIQIFLRAVDRRCLVIVLKAASPALVAKVLDNMSERVRSFLRDEIEQAQPTPEEIRQEQVNVVAHILHMVRQGELAIGGDEEHA